MELLTRKESWNITYDHALGETASWFFVQIRDNAQDLRRRDPKSGRVLVPPRAFSDQTLEPTTEWVEVGPGGRIETFTIVYEQFKTLPTRPTRSATCCSTAPTPRSAASSAASTWPIRRRPRRS